MENYFLLLQNPSIKSNSLLIVNTISLVKISMVDLVQSLLTVLKVSAVLLVFVIIPTMKSSSASPIPFAVSNLSPHKFYFNSGTFPNEPQTSVFFENSKIDFLLKLVMVQMLLISLIIGNIVIDSIVQTRVCLKLFHNGLLLLLYVQSNVIKLGLRSMLIQRNVLML